MHRVLLVFQKNLELGKVKTRLAASVGDQKAFEIYLQLVKHTKNIIEPIEAEKQIWYSSLVDDNDIWDLENYGKFVQFGKDLGARMANSFNNAFSDPDSNQVVIIGSDCAELTTKIINDAFEKLKFHDFVLGPAKDGGYYLLGMKTYQSLLFENIEWSTSNVLQSTLTRINDLNKKYYLLVELNDVDTIEDWEKAKKYLTEV